MKMSTLLLIISTASLFAGKAYSQDAIVSLSVKDTNIRDVFMEIEKQSEYRFFYNENQLDLEKKVNIQSLNSPISDVLNNLFASTDIAYKVIDKHIVLVSMESYQNELENKIVQQQTVTIKGKVTSQNNAIMPGTTVKEKGTQNGTVTDANGNYSIDVNPGATLVFSFVGYEDQEVVVGGQKVIDVAMNESVSMLNEVVVTGYQTQRRSDLTGAVAIVKVDETKDVASGSVLQSVQGKVAGVYITSNGDPSGRATSINIRGVNTLGNTAPLYIIDGVPTIDPNVLQFMDQNSIESFQILKDASAASIYGSRASNGVIIITTKNGKGKMTVEFKTSLSFQKYVRRYDLANTDQYGRIIWQGNINDAMANNDTQYNPGVPGHNPDNAMYSYDWHRDANGVAILDAVHPVQFIANDPTLPSGNTDWANEVMQTGIMSSNSLTISGGTNRTNTLVDLSYFYNKGMVIDTKFNKINVRVNNIVNFFDNKLKLGENIMLTQTSSAPQGSYSGENIIDMANDMLAILPAYKPDGTYGGPIGSGFAGFPSPLPIAEVNKNNRNNNKGLFGNVFLEITPIKNLVFRSNFGLEYNLGTNKVYAPIWTNGILSNPINNMSINTTESTNWTWSNTLTYNLVAGKSRATILVGTEAISNNTELMGTYKEGFAVDNINYYYFNAGTGNFTLTGSATENKLLSYFGNLNYIFADKYMLTGTVRYDGSSRFGQNNRFGLFPAGSVAWVVSKENFMESAKFLSNLKLRAGYGIVGNQAIGDYSRFQLLVPDYNTTSYAIGGQDIGTLPSGYRATQAANPDLKWESTSELNLGIDFGLLDQKITGSFDYFSRNTKNILTTPPIMAVIGEGGSQTLNGATMKNKGWESTLGYSSKKAGDFNFGLSVNLSHFADKITYLPPTVVRNYAGNTEQTIIGHSITSFFGYVTDGLFQNQAEVDAWAAQPGKGIGRIRYKDLNDDNKIDQLDQTWLGTSLPKLLYGVTGDISYKNFNLSLFVTGVSGKRMFDMAKMRFYSFLGINPGFNKGVSLLDAWTPQNTSSTIPMLSNTNNNDEARTSDYSIVNGSYVKLQTAQLTYNIPQKILSQIKLQSVRVYCSGENLLLFFQKKGTRAFTGPDPETPPGYTSGYPKPIKVTFGLDISF